MEKNIASITNNERKSSRELMRARINMFLGVPAWTYPCIRARKQLIIDAYAGVIDDNADVTIWCQDYHLTQRLRPRQLRFAWESQYYRIYVHGAAEVVELALKKYDLENDFSHALTIVCNLFMRGYASWIRDMLPCLHTSCTPEFMARIIMRLLICIFVYRQFYGDVHNAWAAELARTIPRNSRSAFNTEVIACVQCLLGEDNDSSQLRAAICGGNMALVHKIIQHVPVTWQLANDVWMYWLAYRPQEIMSDGMFYMVVNYTSDDLSGRVLVAMVDAMIDNPHTCSFLVTLTIKLSMNNSFQISANVHAYADAYQRLLDRTTETAAIIALAPPEPFWSLTIRRHKACGNSLSADQLCKLIGAKSDVEWRREMALFEYEYTKNPAHVRVAYYVGIVAAASACSLDRIRTLVALIEQDLVKS